MTSSDRDRTAERCPPDLELDRRPGWPDELRLLLQSLPRDNWPSHPHYAVARFWLERHDRFRQHAATLQRATAEHLEGGTSGDAFRRWLAPNLQGFLSALNGHHQIEDQHYFPGFRAAEPRLASGFAALDRDHRLIHASIVELVQVANELLRADDAAPPHPLTHRFAEALQRMAARLTRHLEDEEDLVIPVMLERGG